MGGKTPGGQSKGDHPIPSNPTHQSQHVLAHAHQAALKLFKTKLRLQWKLVTSSIGTQPGPPRHWAKRPNRSPSVAPWSHLDCADPYNCTFDMYMSNIAFIICLSGSLNWLKAKLRRCEFFGLDSNLSNNSNSPLFINCLIYTARPIRWQKRIFTWIDKYYKGKATPKKRLYLGLSPKQRTPPTHPYGLGLQK